MLQEAQHLNDGQWAGTKTLVCDKDGRLITVDNVESTAYLELAATAGDYTYYGRTPATGTRSTSAAIWQIQRRKTDGTEATWADGNLAFDNVWDNRASLTYPVATA